MVFALIPVVLVIVVVVVLVLRKGGKSAASEPTSWPTPESNRPGPSKFSEMSREAAPPLAPTPRPAKASAVGETPPPATPVVAADPPAAVAPVAPVAVPAATPAESESPAPAPEVTATPDVEPLARPSGDAAAAGEEEPVVEEPDLSRFGIPSERKVVAPLEMPKAQVRHLELPPLDAATSTHTDSDPDPGPDALDLPATSVADSATGPDTQQALTEAPEPEAPAEVLDDFVPVVVVEPLDDQATTAAAGSLEFEDETLTLEFDDLETFDDPTDSTPDEDAATSDPDEAVVDVARIDAEAELDRVIGALIDRARATDQSVVEVATELVERANLDEKEATDTLATLMDGDDTTDIVDIAGRLSELTLFNELVPRKPGALTQFGDLDPLTRKRVIVRVLCLLVAKSESDLKSLPKNPASAAETRQWPLARAVWPVPAKKSGADDADLPNRDFGVRR